jgi:hypothetical protein
VFLGAATVGATAYVLGSAVASGVLDRFSSDGGSADLRFRAYHDVAARIGEFLFIGGGTGNSFDVAASSGLVTSYENGPLMYAMDYGVPMALFYLGAAVATLLAAGRAGWRSEAWWAAALSTLTILSFSSVAVNTACGLVLWTLVALAATAAPVREKKSSVAGVTGGGSRPAGTGRSRVAALRTGG